MKPISISALEIPPARVRAHIPALDGARGLAVLMVLLDHSSDSGMHIVPGADFDGAGPLGVFLFFSLSAFLLAYPFWMREPQSLLVARPWLNYWIRRFLRIFPLFLVVLTVTNLQRESFTTTEVVNHLLLRDGEMHFWTIPVEFKFYFILPVLVLVFGAFGRMRPWWQTVLLGGVLALLIEFGFKPLDEWWCVEGKAELDHYLPVFLFGTAAGVLYATFSERKLDLSRFAWLFEIIAFIAFAVIVFSIPAFRIIGSGDVDQEVPAIAWAVFLFALMHGSGYMRRALEFAPLRFMGLISYSAYLWHRMVLRFVDHHVMLPSQAQLWVFLAVSLALATASYLLIERPLAKFKLPVREKVGP